MADRRRINPPLGPTTAPIFLTSPSDPPSQPPQRTRPPHEIRKIFLKTGLTPSASGSAYLELEPSPSLSPTIKTHLNTSTSTLKLTCTVHGPRPLPRSVPFSPHLLLTAHVKFAPFVSKHRRGYIRDTSERDLSVHVETALRGLFISERWPKSGVDVIVTVLEGEDDGPASTSAQFAGGRDSGRAEDNGAGGGGLSGWGTMSLLSGCLTVASAAIADAGIDVSDLVSGGVAAIVRQPNHNPPYTPKNTSKQIILDPHPAEHSDILAICVVGYLRSRDQITEIWSRGDMSTDMDMDMGGLYSEEGFEKSGFEMLLERAVDAAVESRLVLDMALWEATEFKLRRLEMGAAAAAGTDE
ncbi:MAG: hypothetical protein Q9221_006504 [Calogaya cf. arnoldii]